MLVGADQNQSRCCPDVYKPFDSTLRAIQVRFDPDLDYQLSAIHAVVRLFEGAPAARTTPSGFELLHQNGTTPITLNLSGAQRLANHWAIRQVPVLHDASPSLNVGRPRITHQDGGRRQQQLRLPEHAFP